MIAGTELKHAFERPERWAIVAVILSILICVFVVTTRFSDQGVIRDAAALATKLRQVDIEIGQGMLDIRMSRFEPQENWRERAFRRFDAAEKALGELSNLHKEDTEALQTAYGTFRAKLDRAMQPGFGDREVVDLTIALRALSGTIDQVGFDAQNIFDDLALQQAERFRYVLGAAILLLALVGAMAIRSARLRRQAAIDASVSEERFRRFFEMSPLPKSNVDRHGNVLAVNRKFVTTFGYTLDEVPTVGEFRQRVYPDPVYREQASAQHRKLYAEVEATGDSASTELSVTCKDGRVRELVVTVTPLGDGFLNTFEDVTARRRTERTLRESEERFRLIFEESPLPKAYVGTDGTVIAINRKFTELLGYTYDDIPSIDIWLQRVYPEPAYREENSRLWAEKLAGAKPGVTLDIGERRLACRDGAMRYMEITGTLVAGGVIFAFSDVTERKHAEIALRAEKDRSEAAREEAEQMRGRLEAALGAMSDSVLITDMDGNYIHFNDAYARFHRFASRAECPRSIADYLPILEIQAPDGTPVAVNDRPLMKALAGETANDREFRLFRKDKDVHWLASYNYAPIRDGDGHVEGAVVTARDITERHANEERLRDSQAQLAQAQKMEAVGQLTGGIAHDFNNLLAIIIGNIELLLPETDAKTGEMAHTVLRAATRGAELTRRLLAFSRRQTLKPRKVDLNELVGGMTKLLSRTLGEHIRIETRLAPDVDGVVVDTAQLESALLNLAVNARDAMPEGGTITLSTRLTELDADYARTREEVVPGMYEAVSVTDTGTGMPQEVAARAFEPFFTTKGVGKGTGLGLSMVYGFAKQSGGHAAIYSEPGRGTTVTIYLPVAPSDVDAVPRKYAETAAVRTGAGELVLVVEDDPDVRELIHAQLSSLGYVAEVCEDGWAALARLSSGPPPAVMLTDIVMPGGVSGLELADAARKKHPGVPIVFMSGYAEGGSALERIQADGAPFLQKPYTKAQLSEALAQALEAERG